MKFEFMMLSSRFIKDVLRFISLIVSFIIFSPSVMCQETVKTAEEGAAKSITWGLETDFNSKYIWRGTTVNDGLVIQPFLWASYRNFTAGLWSSVTLYDRHHLTREHELDLNLDYTWSLGNFQFEHSVMIYYYLGMEDSPTTGEFFLGVTYPIGDFAITSNVSADFISYFGSLYFEHGFQYEKEIGKQFSVNTSAVLGWGNGKFNESYIGTSKKSLNLISLNCELTYKTKGIIYFKPHVQVSKTINHEIASYLGNYPWFCGLLIGFQL